MKWAADLSETTMELETRGMRWRRQLRRLVVVAGLLTLLLFFGLHPAGREMTKVGVGAAQTVWQWADQQVVQHFGPALLLRLRAQWALARLEDDLVWLRTVEEEAAHRATMLAAELPTLVAAQETAQQQLLVLTAQVQPTEPLAATALRTDEVDLANRPRHLAEVSAPVMTYLDLAEQVSRHQQTASQVTAVVAQSRALQQAGEQMQTNAGVLQDLFTALWQQRRAGAVAPTWTAGELAALRTAFQTQLTQAQEIHRLRRALEAEMAALPLPTAAVAADPSEHGEASVVPTE